MKKSLIALAALAASGAVFAQSSVTLFGVVDLAYERVKTNTGTMTVDNGSDHDLAKPDLYVLDGSTGKQIDGKVLNAQPVPQGGKQTFKVQFPPEVNDKELGLVILLFGPDNYGAFAPA